MAAPRMKAPSTAQSRAEAESPVKSKGQSAAWRKRRAAYIAEHGLACRGCGKDKAKNHLHHLEYTVLGQEPDDDLIPLCGRCHKALHLWAKYHSGLDLRAASKAFINMPVNYFHLVERSGETTLMRILFSDAAPDLKRLAVAVTDVCLREAYLGTTLSMPYLIQRSGLDSSTIEECLGGLHEWFAVVDPYDPALTNKTYLMHPAEGFDLESQTPIDTNHPNHRYWGQDSSLWLTSVQVKFLRAPEIEDLVEVLGAPREQTLANLAQMIDVGMVKRKDRSYRCVRGPETAWRHEHGWHRPKLPAVVPCKNGFLLRDEDGVQTEWPRPAVLSSIETPGFMEACFHEHNRARSVAGLDPIRWT